MFFLFQILLIEMRYSCSIILRVFQSVHRNILLPLGVPLQRQRAVYRIAVFRAEDLPRTDLGLLASVQKAVTNKDIAFIDPYIKVSFVGHVVSITYSLSNTLLNYITNGHYDLIGNVLFSANGVCSRSRIFIYRI